MKIEFMSSVSVIAPDPAASRELFLGALGLPLERASAEDEYFHTEKLDGCRHFGVWPLSQAAQACFGSPEWPSDRPVPQASVEFDVADAGAVQDAVEELGSQGYELLHATREEPWGQTVARVQSPEGLIVGISFAPWMH
jgi:catechol 2,3-dioxygenase-like lactoylglutathione lyase family enzyme